MYKLDEYGRLDVSSKDLTSLYELPDGLIELICSRNRLGSLPKLPKSTKMLYCYINNISYIAELPSGLEVLNCSHNKLRFLPELPDSLLLFKCDNNPLECLIPSKFLICHNNVWLKEYYYPYIDSYSGQKNILNRQPEMVKELMEQTKILDNIRKEFSYLFDSYELNLL